MRKSFILLFLFAIMLSGCRAQGSEDQIKVYTRDGSSGTREAFESIAGIKSITHNSAETTGNGDMATQVGQAHNAIGYVSLATDFKGNGIKPLQYLGVLPSIDSVNQGSYQLARPFSFVTRREGDYESDEKQALVLAFLDYLNNSIEGKEIVLAAGGIVDVSKGVLWEDLKQNHPIVLRDNTDLVLKTGGSTSVEPTIKPAVESFIPMAGNFKYEPNHTGSGDGYKRTLGSEKSGANHIDIGFSSRKFKKEEPVSEGMTSGVYCMDAVVVVVNETNTLDDISPEQLQQIFSGELSQWKDLV
ncbi:substrate-binding domain-containing protein [Erysipelothrix rhusiopathiae]|nr:substrate-binding domain-containing protein [Erysipelothrix rhusiopathiae]